MMMMMIVSYSTFYEMSSLQAVQHVCTSTDFMRPFFS